MALLSAPVVEWYNGALPYRQQVAVCNKASARVQFAESIHASAWKSRSAHMEPNYVLLTDKDHAFIVDAKEHVIGPMTEYTISMLGESKAITVRNPDDVKDQKFKEPKDFKGKTISEIIGVFKEDGFSRHDSAERIIAVFKRK